MPVWFLQLSAEEPCTPKPELVQTPAKTHGPEPWLTGGKRRWSLEPSSRSQETFRQRGCKLHRIGFWAQNLDSATVSCRALFLKSSGKLSKGPPQINSIYISTHTTPEGLHSIVFLPGKRVAMWQRRFWES